MAQLLVMVLLAVSFFGMHNMWALLDYDNKTVIGVIPPDQSIENNKIQEEINGRKTILMTLENSPAWINGQYKDKKFYPPEELING